MTKLYLRYLKDYDIIQMLNERIPEIIKKKNLEYHNERYNYRKNQNSPYWELYLKKRCLDEGFWIMTLYRQKYINVSFIQPCYPFYITPKNRLNVKHAIKIYEEYSKRLK